MGESLTNLRLVISLLARRNFHLQAISRRGQRTGCIWVVGARRIGSLVEVDLDLSILRRISIKKARCLVGIFLACEIAKNNKQATRTIVFSVELIFFTAKRESYVAGKVSWATV